MNSMKVKDLGAIAKSHGLRGYSRLKKSDLIHMIGKCDTEVFENDFLIEVSEDDCEDLTDYEDLFAKKVKVLEGGLTIEVSEDDCEDLPDGW